MRCCTSSRNAVHPGIVHGIDTKDVPVELPHRQRVRVDFIERGVANRSLRLETSLGSGQAGRAFRVVHKILGLAAGAGQQSASTGLPFLPQLLSQDQVLAVPKVARITPDQLKHHVGRNNALNGADSFCHNFHPVS
jgi:hypothetical protein